MDTHEERTEIFQNRKVIESVNSANDLTNFKKDNRVLYDAVEEVANCYHFVGLLMKHKYIKDEKVFVEEAQISFQQIHSIIKGVIAQERIMYKNPQYKCYLEYLEAVIKKYGSANDATMK
jgi:hypothetical protein